MFPDRRNATARTLTELLRSDDAEQLVQPRFGRGSVAGQGLPALERLLFEGDVPNLLSGADPRRNRRCQVGIAIAINLAMMADDIRREWGGRDVGILAKLARGEGDVVFFPEPSAALTILLTDLAGLFQRAVDMKMLPILGQNPADAKPLLAEARRSGRSARNLRVAVESGAELAALLAESTEPSARETVERAFAAARDAARAVPSDLGAAAADARERVRLDAAVRAFKGAQRAVATPLAPALGSSLGFNALDGD
jgi:predicted lipoprotein